MYRNCGKDIQPPESRSFKLQFSNAISLPVFTGTRIEGEGCTSMEVALVDIPTGQVVSSGLGSSCKVELVVLEGDFDGDDGDNWTLEDFRNNIVREREGKKPLLTGDVIFILKDGKGLVGDASFTDNSSWTRSRTFRLGARLIDDVGGIRIREARSEPFVVRDHRGELYKKHHPPSLSDEVWRLEKIGKDGAFHRRLSREGVNTVHDFLVLLSLDPTKLRNILGTGMSAKKWKTTVEHARTCVLDKTLYLYNSPTSLQKNSVVFNVVGRVTGMFLNSQYVPTDKMSEEEKVPFSSSEFNNLLQHTVCNQAKVSLSQVNAQELVISAFGDREKIVTLAESSLNMPTSSCSLDAQTSSNLLPEGSCHQDSTSLNFMQSFHTVGGSTSFDYYLHGDDAMEIRYDQPLSFPCQVADSFISDPEPMDQSFCDNEHLSYFEEDFPLQSSDFELPADLHTAINAFIPRSVVHIERAQRWWNVLVCVLRWFFSIKRIIARKTHVRARPPSRDVVIAYIS
ncbi:UNVERIFIED_CONTAM: Calmodulin-binding protein 60 A [Sesamum radiatum]|uniref:Calmodulin-binding protein 60 A n=1 Tax=Sesamum radiatum TaxID=300843 RepID=A0AAW2RXK0_SESRA